MSYPTSNHTPAHRARPRPRFFPSPEREAPLCMAWSTTSGQLYIIQAGKNGGTGWRWCSGVGSAGVKGGEVEEELLSKKSAREGHASRLERSRGPAGDRDGGGARWRRRSAYSRCRMRGSCFSHGSFSIGQIQSTARLVFWFPKGVSVKCNLTSRPTLFSDRME